jgi:aspartyl-tRNA synthetase
MPYAEAMAKYGSDKPDLRPGMRSRSLATFFRETPFSVFRGALDAGGEVRGFVVPARPATRGASWTNSSSRRRRSARRARLGARARGRPCRARR